jgi:hypothetical protein
VNASDAPSSGGGDNGPAENPLDDLRVSIAVPEIITVRMVDATAFADYEVGFFAAGLFATFAGGFFIAGVSALAMGSAVFVVVLFLVLTLLFTALMLGAVGYMLEKRRAMLSKSKSIPFRRSAG